MSDVTADEEDGYAIKYVQFGVIRVAIVTQETDGPCPLIAIVNALVLRGAISLPSGAHWVAHDTLVRMLTEYAHEINQVPPNASAEVRANVEANVAASVRVLSSPAMRRGMLVNPSLTSVTAFEFTPEIGVFDLFRLRPVHGWLVAPSDSPRLRAFFARRSYNQIQDAIARLLHDCDLTSGSTVTDEEDEILPGPIVNRRPPDDTHEQAALANAWFQQHSGQLTSHGLKCLERSVVENEIAILFRNNHFSTLIRHEGRLYTIMSAAAYLDAPRFVFQRVAVHGRHFLSFDGSFRSLSAAAPAPPRRHNTTPGSAAEASRLRSGAEVREMRLQRELSRQPREIVPVADDSISTRRRLKQEEIDRRYARRVQAIYDAQNAATLRNVGQTARNEMPTMLDSCVIT